MHSIVKNHLSTPRAGVLFATVLASVAGFVGYAAGRTSAGLEAGDSSARATTYVDSGSPPTISDRRKKENFRQEDPDQVLEKIGRLAIQSWNYRSQSASVRHIGPTAQDFYASFRLGESDTTIAAADMAGVSLLAVQALQRRVDKLEAQLRTGQPVAAEAPARAETPRRR